MESSSSEDRRRRVPWWTGPLAFAGLACLLFVISGGIRVLMSLVRPETVRGWFASPVGLSVQVFVMSSLFAGIAWGVPLLWRVSPKQWLGLRRVSGSVFVFAGLGIVGLGFLVDEVVFLLHSANPTFFNPSGLDMFNQMFQRASLGGFIALTAVVTLGPGIGEELFFRGLMMRSLLAGMPPAAAVLISAVLFGLIHFDVLQSPGAAVIGIYLGIVAYRSNSLFPAMVAHGVNNLLCALFAHFSDDASKSPILTGHPAWIIIASTAVFIGSLALFFRATKSPESEHMGLEGGHMGLEGGHVGPEGGHAGPPLQ
jgi:membrane protease YdiL (CAAX protease family)